ncbi:sortase [Patescibacteria group bacterium]
MEKKVYIKDRGFDPMYQKVPSTRSTETKIVPSLLVLGGIFILITQVVIPLAIFSTQDELADEVTSTVLGKATGFAKFEFPELYSDILGAESENTTTKANVPDYFYITIPKLNIGEAKVETNAKTLNPDKALGHYKGTALPGQVGNTFIFGHSVLPVFYNPRNYKTIFSKLGDLKMGDEFYVKYNNKTLTYKVEGLVELAPSKVAPLAEMKPKYLNESTMVLMTCSPPGTKLRRLMVNAVMVN